MNKPANPTTLLLLSIVSLINTMVLIGCMANGAKGYKDDWIRARKAGAVSCSPAGSRGAENTLYQMANTKELNRAHQSTNDTGAAGNDKGNGCAHQPGAGTLCERYGPNRRFLKKHSC